MSSSSTWRHFSRRLACGDADVGPGPLDDELAGAFRDESRSCLDNLERGLLSLDDESHASGSDPSATIAELFRNAHTLKGSAAVLGLTELAAVAHAMEDVLDAGRHAEQLTTPQIDALLDAVDHLRQLVPAALAGAHHDPGANAAVAGLRGLATGSPSPAAPGRDDGASAATVAVAGPRPPVAADDEAGGVVRVGAERLDTLVKLTSRSAIVQRRLGAAMARTFEVDAGSLAEFRELGDLLDAIEHEVASAGLVPVASLGDRLRRTVRDVARASGKQIELVVEGGDTALDRRVVEQLTEPLVHLARNAAAHGVEPPAERTAAGKPPAGMVRVRARQLGAEVLVDVEDDGAGVDFEAVRAAARALDPQLDTDSFDRTELLAFLFHPGLSTASSISEISGRGVGLDVVRDAVEAIGGGVAVDSEPGRRTRFTLRVPVNLAVAPCVIVRAGEACLGIPLAAVDAIVTATATSTADGQRFVWVRDEPVPASELAPTLGLAEQDRGAGPRPAVVLRGGDQRRALLADSLEGHARLILRALSGVLPASDVVAGTAVAADGSLVVVLAPEGVLEKAAAAATTATVGGDAPGPVAPQPAPRILVVDDSLAVRLLQQSILERAGYEVSLAADGAEALTRAAAARPDLVLTDLSMPRMDGVALTTALRADPALASVPVVMLTAFGGDDDRRAAAAAGASEFIVKRDFDEAVLLATVRRLLGTTT